VTADIVVENLYYAYPPLAPDEPHSPRPLRAQRAAGLAAVINAESTAAVSVLRDVSFEVARGESVVLLGRVGSGKTTLCMALNGLVPHMTGGVFRGNVHVLGRNTREHPVADMAAGVGLVFQDAESQLVQMRVEDEVAFGLENLGVPSAEMEDRVRWALDAVGLSDYRERSPLLLSGGEKQRVAIAAMLAMQPRVLVLDEPTASLDPAGKIAVFKVLQELRRRHDITIFMATQELERITRFADRVLVLHDGRIALDGPPTEVLRHVPKLQEMGVGVPQVVELGYILSKRAHHRYRFVSNAGAYEELRKQALKSKMRKTARRPEVRNAPLGVAPRVDPLADTSQITFEHVSYMYDDGHMALRDVNLVIHPGDFVALLGPNGAGKTTLARHFNGLARPTGGRVLVEHQDTRTTSVAKLAQLVGYVFQNPDHQIFSATVEEEIAFGPRMQEMPPAIVARRVAEELDRFRLSAYAGTPPALLGFGQRRQVALAAIIAMQPKVLILDEPTGGLDWRSQQELMSVLAAFNAMGRTVVLITHDMRLVAEYTTRAVALSDGQVLFDGTTRELFSRGDVLAQGQLAVPAVTRLARRLRVAGMPSDVLTCAEFAAAWLARLPAGGKAPRDPSAAARNGKRKKVTTRKSAARRGEHAD
jgi:energy-coupling factor transporter ATP-binding protein EcfA2